MIGSQLAGFSSVDAQVGGSGGEKTNNGWADGERGFNGSGGRKGEWAIKVPPSTTTTTTSTQRKLQFSRREEPPGEEKGDEDMKKM
jgi:hypothetical protein